MFVIGNLISDKQQFHKMVEMGKISVIVSDELEEKVRQKAIKKFGIKKGYLSNAATEALEAWTKE